MSSPKILYAEDHAIIADLTSAALRRAGYEVIHAKSGAEALKTFRAAPAEYKLLFTDHEMPGLGGLELMRQLRADGFAGPVVVNSGYLTPSEREAYEGSGPVQFLTKPSNAAELISVMKSSWPTE